MTLLSPHLSEGRPLLLLLHVGVVAGVMRVITGVTVSVEDIGCAEFVQRSESNTRCIPETDSAVLVPETKRFKGDILACSYSPTAPISTCNLHLGL